MRNKGKSGIPTDEYSLTLAANIEDAEPIMIRTYQALTGSNGASSELVKSL
jgi:hypothetical protein